MVSVTYTELLESLPLVLGELVRQRVLRFVQYRAPRLLVLGFLAQSDHTSERAGSTKKGTSTGAGTSMAGVGTVGKMVFTGCFVLEAFEPIRGVGRR